MSQVNGFSAFLCMGQCKSGVIEILPEIMHLNYLRACLSKAQRTSSWFFILNSPQGALLVGDHTGLRLNPCIAGWWATLFFFWSHREYMNVLMHPPPPFCQIHSCLVNQFLRDHCHSPFTLSCPAPLFCKPQRHSALHSWFCHILSP